MNVKAIFIWCVICSMYLISDASDKRDNIAAGHGENDISIKYVWLDEMRLLLVSSDVRFVSFVSQHCMQQLQTNEIFVGVIIIDYGVVPPWNGTFLQCAFPSHPRPSIEGNSFEVGKIEIFNGDVDLFAQKIFIYDWLKRNPCQWVKDFWLLRTAIEGWESANLYKTLVSLPDGINAFQQVNYLGKRLPFSSYEGSVSPHGWASMKSLPATISYNGIYPRLSVIISTPILPAKFYPREYGFAEMIIHNFPNNAEGYVMRARLKCEINDEAALSDYNQAISLSSNTPEIYAQRSQIYYRHNMLIDAYCDAVIASECDPFYTDSKTFYMKVGAIESD